MEYAVIGVMCGLMCLLFMGVGVLIGMLLYRLRKTAPPEAPKQELSAEETEAIRREREELKASIEHFNSMMRYDADTAYGMDDPADKLARG